MANKKDATASLTNLQHYLRRDHAASAQLEDISRYLGSLRQERSSMKSELEEATKKTAATRTKLDELESQVSQLKAELQREQSQHKQTKNDLTNTECQLVDLQKTVEPQEPGPEASEGRKVDKREFIQLLKELQRRTKKAPQPIHGTTSDKILMFEIRELVTDYTVDDFIYLGQFAVASCLMNIPIGFKTKGLVVTADSAERERMILRWVQWIQGWLRSPKWQEEIMAAGSQKSLSNFIHP